MTNSKEKDAVLTVEINQDICIGAGNCVIVSPTVFTQRDDDGIVELLEEHPSVDLVEEVEEAVESCPALAIKLLKSDS